MQMRTHRYIEHGVYVAADRMYWRSEPNSTIHRLAIGGHVFVFGYSSSKQDVGFCRDAETLAIFREINRLAWVYDSERGILRSAEVFKNAKVGVARGANHADVSIIQPDAELLAKNDCLAHYRKALKFHEIKQRRNVPSIEPAAPLLAQLGIGTNATPLLDYVVAHSAFVLEWLFSECGTHFRSIDGTANAKAFLLAKFAEANLPVFEIDDPDDLPYD